MTRAKLGAHFGLPPVGILLLGSLCVALTGLAACGFASASNDEAAPGPPGATKDGGSAGQETPQGPVATGVILVHAASFPSFRVCFENYPELRPQPDSKVMPAANVVGVEVGSAVRIEPLARDPGRIYVIDQSVTQASIGSDEPTCGERICDDDPERCLRKNAHYHELPPLTAPIGTDEVAVLAIAGCGNKIFLDAVGASPDRCGSTWKPNDLDGDLASHVLPLTVTSSVATETTLPVQLLHLSPRIEEATVAGELDISFGDLEKPGRLEQTVARAALFASTKQQSLSIDQRSESYYAMNGFRIRGSAGGVEDAGAFEVSQSLAQIQDLSAPREVPTEYYRAASNYALLLLGDPAIGPILEDGGANPAYARRGVHLLAVPVIDPNADAGAGDAGSDAAAGDAEGGDGG